MKTARMKKFSENDEAAAADDNDDIKDGNKKMVSKVTCIWFWKMNMHVMIKSWEKYLENLV